MSGCQRLASLRRASCTARLSNGACSSSNSSDCSRSRIRATSRKRYRGRALRAHVCTHARPVQCDGSARWAGPLNCNELASIRADSPVSVLRWSNDCRINTKGRAAPDHIRGWCDDARRALCVTARGAGRRRQRRPVWAWGKRTARSPGGGTAWRRSARRRNRVRRAGGPEQRVRRLLWNEPARVPGQLRRAGRNQLPDRDRDGWAALHDSADESPGAVIR